MSFLIDPPWLYANGRAYAALAPERAQGRTAAAAGAATMAVFWGVSISLYLNRPWTRWIWRLCRAERRARLDAQLRRAAARPARRRAGDARRQRGAVRQLPLLAVARLARRAARDDGGAVPARRARQGPLRVLLPARGRPGAPARRLDPLHDAPAPRPAADRLRVVHVLRRRGRAARTPSSRRCPAPSPTRRLDRDRRERVRAGRRARAGGGRGPLRRLGARDARRRRAAAPSPPRVDVPRAAPAHQAREPAAERDVRRHARGRRARPRRDRGLARHGRPQLGRRARRDLDLAARRRVRGRAGRLAGPVGRARARRPAADPVDRQRRAARPRRAHPARRSPARARGGDARGLPRRDRRRGRRGALPRRPDRRLALRRPGGGEHHSLNCSIAQVTVRHAGRELRTAHGGVYELGIPPGAHGVELQPFPDG